MAAGAVESLMQTAFIYDGTPLYAQPCVLFASHFTGKERDAESGLDYFGARYYASSMGRFMSPDWSAKATPVPYAVLNDPQSLNLYAYVRNNPLTRTDPTGHLGCGFLWLGNCSAPPPPLPPPPPPPGSTTWRASNACASTCPRPSYTKSRYSAFATGFRRTSAKR